MIRFDANLRLFLHILIVFCLYLNIRIIYQVANSDEFKEVNWRGGGLGGNFRSWFKMARKRNFEDRPRRSPESRRICQKHVILYGLMFIDDCGNDNNQSTPTVIDLLDDDDDDDDDNGEQEEREEEKESCSIANEEGTARDNGEEDIIINRAGGENVIDLLEDDDDDDDDYDDCNDKNQSIIRQTIQCSRNKQASRGNTNEDENARTNQSGFVSNDVQIMVDREEKSIIDLLEDDDDDDDDDDVVVLEQGQAVEFQIEVDNDGNEDDDDDCDDAVIIGSTGKNANSDYAHSRADCATNPFEKDPKIYCPNVSKVVFVLMSCSVCYYNM